MNKMRLVIGDWSKFTRTTFMNILLAIIKAIGVIICGSGGAFAIIAGFLLILDSNWLAVLCFVIGALLLKGYTILGDKLDRF